MSQPPNRFTRLATMFIDHMVMSLIVAVPIFLFSADTLTRARDADGFMVKDLIVYSISLGIYLCKDSFNGRSIGKRMVKYQVLCKTQPADPLRCVIRNFTIIIWPIEVIVVLISPTKRLGDLLAGTKTIATSTPISDELNYTRVWLALGIASSYLFIVLKFIMSLF